MAAEVTGKQLPPNLYTDPRKRQNYWRYRRPDGTFRTFQASQADAIRMALEANQLRDQPNTAPLYDASVLPLWVEKYIAYREDLDPVLAEKTSWQNRKAALYQFAKLFSAVPLYELNLNTIREWWDGLTGNAQRSRRPEYNKFFNYLMMEGAVKLQSNPFSTADDRPRVINKRPPARQRKRLTLEQYRAIHALAPDYLQIAMDLSLYTTMRRGDIAELRWDTNIVDGNLQKQISKSHAKLGDDGANLLWSLSEHPQLKSIIDAARILAMKHGRCPYVVSRQPSKARTGKTKDHPAQVTGNFLSKAFTEAAREANVTGVSFHEIRALAAFLYGQQYGRSEVKELMAHTNESMTAHYQRGHVISWHKVGISLAIPKAYN